MAQYAPSLPWRIPKATEFVLAVVGVFSLQQVMEGYLFFQDKIPLPESIRPFLETVRKLIEETYTMLVQAHSPSELLFVIIVVALTPAICEELLFRGLIQKNMTLATNKKWGFVFTGIIFGLYHVNPFLIVPLVGLGILFGFFMARSETILIPMAAHFINNLVSVIGVYYESDIKDSSALSMFNSLSDYSATFVLSTTDRFWDHLSYRDVFLLAGDFRIPCSGRPRGIRMMCAHCHSVNTEAALFCAACGYALRAHDVVECENHSGTNAIGICVVCGKPVCGDCSVARENKLYCDDVAHSQLTTAHTKLGDVATEFEADMIDKKSFFERGTGTSVFHEKVFPFLLLTDNRSVSIFVKTESIEEARRLIEEMDLEEFLIHEGVRP